MLVCAVLLCTLASAGCGLSSERFIGPDAGGTDAVAAQTCFGSGFMQLCLQTPPTGQWPVATPPPPTPIQIDTSPKSSDCAPLMTGGDYCVVAGTTITIDTIVRATGSRPLVLLASDSITVNGSGIVDVGSHRSGSSAGPGAGEATDGVCHVGMPPADPAIGGISESSAVRVGGGGAGGSFILQGGMGGHGAGIPETMLYTSTGGGPWGSVTAESLTSLRGGCPGQQGASQEAKGVAPSGGAGGDGGGAVFLIAGNTITINGSILAGGEGGAGATNIGQASGGGGGGTGGTIGFDAMVIMAGSSSVIATGGGGGQGGDSGRTATAAAGEDGSFTTAAAGGAGGSGANGGSGGAGSIGPGPGLDGAIGALHTGGGGGGGGGGGPGVILVLRPSSPTAFHDVAPQPTFLGSSN
jgi:hypothetical protein